MVHSFRVIILYLHRSRRVDHFHYSAQFLDNYSAQLALFASHYGSRSISSNGTTLVFRAIFHCSALNWLIRATCKMSTQLRIERKHFRIFCCFFFHRVQLNYRSAKVERHAFSNVFPFPYWNVKQQSSLRWGRRDTPPFNGTRVHQIMMVVCDQANISLRPCVLCSVRKYKEEKQGVSFTRFTVRFKQGRAAREKSAEFTAWNDGL